MHSLTQEFMGTVMITGEPVPLAAVHSVVIPALCMGRIPHGLTLDLDGGEESTILLVREPGALLVQGLLVEQGPISAGAVETVVFNLTNSEIRVRKGVVVSRLIRVLGSRWV